MNRNSGQPEVLVIDDDICAANSFSELITVKYHFRTIATSSPEEAIEIVKNNPIKVVVLDQVMPDMKGTELYKKVRVLNKAIKALMLTGEAKRNEVDEAYKLGYSDYLDKSNIAILPNKVLDLYVKYEVDIIKSLSDNHITFLYKERGFKNFFCPVEYYIYDITVLNKEYIFEDHWRTMTEVCSDEMEVEESIEYEDEFFISKECESKITTEMQVSSKNIASLVTKINGEIKNKYTAQYSMKNKQKRTQKNKYALPKETADGIAIVKRVIETTPIYVEYNIVLCKRCLSCGSNQLMPIITYKRTPKFATRIIDYLYNGKSKITPTGFIQK